MSSGSDNILLDNSKTKLNDATRMILKYWYTKCKVYYKCHKESSIYYDKLNKYMGIPTVLMGIFNTTTIFSNYVTQNQPLIIINGTASFIATVLSAMQNYFDLGKLTITHSKLANGYNKITNTIEKILMFERLTNMNEISSKTIDNMMNQMEYLHADAPTIPDKIWNKNKVELKNIINIILSNENIAKELSTQSSVRRMSISNERDSPSVNDIESGISSNGRDNNKNNIEIVYSNSK